jgi:hypothetical protein
MIRLGSQSKDADQDVARSDFLVSPRDGRAMPIRLGGVTADKWAFVLREECPVGAGEMRTWRTAPHRACEGSDCPGGIQEIGRQSW